MWRKIQQTISVQVFDLQTPKPEHGCKIKTDYFFGWEIYTVMIEASYDLSGGQEK